MTPPHCTSPRSGPGHQNLNLDGKFPGWRPVPASARANCANIRVTRRQKLLFSIPGHVSAARCAVSGLSGRGRRIITTYSLFPHTSARLTSPRAAAQSHSAWTLAGDVPCPICWSHKEHLTHRLCDIVHYL